MNIKKGRFSGIAACLLACALQASHASAATIWDEAVNGDLASDPAAPTGVSFSAGSNVVAGDVNSATDMRDYFTFTLAPDQALEAITLLSYQGNIGFTAINAGATGVIPGLTTVLDFLGGAHTNPTLVGDPLLPLLASGAVAGIGFDIPLGPGVYTYLIQQTSGDLTSYALEFQVAPVPAPAAVWLLGSGLMGLAAWRRFRSCKGATT